MSTPQREERPVLTGWNKLFHSSDSSEKAPVPVPADNSAWTSPEFRPSSESAAQAAASATTEPPTIPSQAPFSSSPTKPLSATKPPVISLAARKAIERENDEFLDKMTICLRNRDLMGMGSLFLETCPGDETKLENIFIREIIRRTVADPASYYEMHDREIYKTIYFRWEYGILTDYLVAKLGLNVPNFRICLLWNRPFWEAEADKRMPPMKRKDLWDVFTWALRRGDFGLRPGMQQGCEFDRPREYLAAAIIQADRSMQESLELVEKSIEFFQQARDGTIP